MKQPCFLSIIKAQKPPQKPSPASASSAPIVKDTLVKKTELKLKTDAASTFQAFKRTEVKVCVSHTSILTQLKITASL